MIYILFLSLTFLPMTIIALFLKHKYVDVFNPLLIVTIFFITFYYIPLFYFHIDSEILLVPRLAEEIPIALSLVTVFLIFLLIGYIIGSKMQFYTRYINFNFSKRVWLLTGVFYLIAWIGKIILIVNGQYFQSAREEAEEAALISYASILSNMAVVSLLLFGAHFYRVRKDSFIYGKRYLRKVKTAFTIMYLIEFLYYLPTGRKEMVLLIPLLILYLRSFYIRPVMRSEFILFIIGGLLFVLIYFPISYFYRISVETSFYTHRIMNPLENILLAISNFREILLDSEYIKIGFEYVLKRIGSTVEPFLQVIYLTPHSIDYKYGVTYLLTMVSFIPRFLWKDKPTITIGNEFGKEYGLISPFDDFTHISIGVPGEAYMNFGFLGIIFVGIILGFVYAITYKNLFRSGIYDSSVVIYFLFLYTFTWGINGAFASAVSGFIKYLFILLPLMLLIRK